MYITRYTLILALFGLISSENDKIFYAKVKTKFKPLRSFTVRRRTFLSYTARRKHTVPVFTLRDGLAYTGHGNNTKYFTVMDGHMILGRKENITPLKITLDWDFRVNNLHFTDCTMLWDDFKASIHHRSTSNSAYSCVPINIYLMTSLEANLHEPTYTSYGK